MSGLWQAGNRSSVYRECAATRLLPWLWRRIYDRDIQVLFRVWLTALRGCYGQHRTLLLQLRTANINCLSRALRPLWGQSALSVTGSVT